MASASLDPAEPELAWRGYSGWAMLPSFIICALLTLLLLTGSWFVEYIRGIEDEVGTWVFFTLIWIIWGTQLARWLYRGSTYMYRLTNQHLLIDRGFFHSPVPPIPLEQIQQITWGSSYFRSLFGVGWILIRITDRSPQKLRGVLNPKVFAELIQTHVDARKQALSGK